MSGFFVHLKKGHLNHAPSAAFTLVEMLAVMGILVVLLAVTVPTFKGLNQGGARKAAVSNLMGALDRARTMAVSEGKAAYVVFYAARNPPIGALTDPGSTPWGSAYAIYQDLDNVNFAPVQRTPWIPLPSGVSFKVDTSNQMTSITNVLDLFNAQGDPDVASTDNSAPPAFPVSKAASRDKAHLFLPFLKFDATGALDEKLINQPANYLRILMFPGYLKADGTEIATQSGGASNPGTLEEIDVNPVTGRAKYVVNSADNLSTSSPTSSSNPQS